MAKLSGDKTYVTVEKGDTLSEIAVEFKAYSKNATYQQLAAINGIPNPDYIVVGQIVKLVKSGGGSTTKATSQTKATVTQFGLQSNSDNTLYATWSWSRSHTENYEIEWCYDTGNGVWFVGSKSTTEDKQSTYSIPSNAKKVRFRVKPVSKKYTSNNKETSYWTASWSTAKTYNTNNLPPLKPSTPSTKMDGYKLTVEINNIDAVELRATGVQFQIVKNDNTVYKTGKATINTKTNYVSYACTVGAGADYKVRARTYRGNEYSEWSDYSGDVKTVPSTPSGMKTIKATSETSIYLEWNAVSSAKTYDIEYATNKNYFDRTDQTTLKTEVEHNYFEFIGLESGEEYFFRVRAVNESGPSAWMGIESVVIGKDPAPPTTWSSTTTVVTGEKLTLYCVHNSEDNSSQTFAELELHVNGEKTVHTIQNSTDEDKKDLTSFYEVDTSEYVEGTEIQWRVRTAGITNVYGEWSIQRTVNVYAPPVLELTVTDYTGNMFDILTSFPIHIEAVAGPDTQTPIGYVLTVTANETYETINQIGETVMVGKGSTVYSRHFDVSEPLCVDLSAGDLDLENDINYTINCIVSMNSGLTADSALEFTVNWTDEEYAPNAEINLDKDTLAVNIRPFCNRQLMTIYKVVRENKQYIRTDEVIEDIYGETLSSVVTNTGEQVCYGTTGDGEQEYYCEVLIDEPVEDITLSVYRREFDGGFVEIGSGIDNASNTFITDPHPALDFARYRVVAISNSTGAVSYYDVPGYPIGESAIIIQWDEEWSNFDISNEDEMLQPAWAGSLLRLPYNIDISTNSDQDVTLVNYIGREHPVSYYGTQLGHTATWTTDVVRSDEDTMYALRRLQNWMGDVYVREPSGTGYWANIKVSFNEKHKTLTIPVTINVKRVEGGV